MTVNTNLDALRAMRYMGNTNNAFTNALERLSSGLRINHAADDAAALSVGEKLDTQVRGFYQAVRNAQDSISLLQTAEGGLVEIHDMLQRMRQLTVQGANDTMTVQDRAQIVTEMTELKNEMTDIANQTTFNTKPLLDGSVSGAGALVFQVGPNQGEQLSIQIAPALGNVLVGFLPNDTDNATIWSDFIITVDDGIAVVSSIRSDLGAMENRLDHVIRNLGVGGENATTSESRIQDADVAGESVTLSREVILRSSGTAVLAQANAAPQMMLRLLR